MPMDIWTNVHNKAKVRHGQEGVKGGAAPGDYAATRNVWTAAGKEQERPATRDSLVNGREAGGGGLSLNKRSLETV